MHKHQCRRYFGRTRRCVY